MMSLPTAWPTAQPGALPDHTEVHMGKARGQGIARRLVASWDRLQPYQDRRGVFSSSPLPGRDVHPFNKQAVSSGSSAPRAPFSFSFYCPTSEGRHHFLFCQNNRLAQSNWHGFFVGDSEGAHRTIFGQQTRLRSYRASHIPPNRQME